MPKLIPVFIDYETFWDTHHSLSKMNPMDYVMHPDTEIISCSLKIGADKTVCVFGEEDVRNLLNSVDWSDKLLIAHNNEGFDSMVSAWRFGIKPAMWGCTLAMARPIHAKTAGGSLKALSDHYQIGTKDSTALMNTKGLHLKDFSQSDLRDMERYNIEDTELCARLFLKLLPETSNDEMRLIDATIRMLVEPQIEVDVPMLEQALKDELQRKHDLLVHAATLLDISELEYSNDDELKELVAIELRSNNRFAKFLRDQGVEPPTKISKTTGKTTFALAKTDEEFIALTTHENPIVATIASARLGIKSSILETRIKAFITTATACGGKLPIPLKYYGADTTGRWSGWAYNPQNLPRVDPKNPKPSDVLRNCLRAPKGYKIVVADLSGIELRVNHFLWKVPSSMALFQADPEKADLYKEFASALYNILVSEVTKNQRQVGKVAHLGLGFGAGAATFKKVAKVMAGIDLTDEEAEEVVRAWRAAYVEIARGWRTCHEALPAIAAGATYEIDPWGMCVTTEEGIKTPRGLIRYPNLRAEVNDKGKMEWVYGEGRNLNRIYAGKIDENCLAEGTLVLTEAGWKPIELVGPDDRVHDGDSFVPHGGIVLKSVQPCVNVDGVLMTKDHEVLDENGAWAEASQIPRPYRPAIRSADRLASFAHQRKDVVVDVPLRLRADYDESRGRRDEGVEARGDSELRMPVSFSSVEEKQHSRAFEAPAVWSVPEHDRSLSATVAQSMEKLRGAWDSGMRQVGYFVRELLGRHAPNVPARAGAGPEEQQRSLFPGELSLGQPKDQHPEQTEQSGRGFSDSRGDHWRGEVYSVLQAETRAPFGRSCRQEEEHKVYDIMNAGPRHRFVVLGENGPFIVHNCVQHLARCILADNVLQIQKVTGLLPALMVHDELVFLVPEDKAQETLDTVQSIMRTPPTWWPELVTWSEGDIGDTYGAAK